VGVPRYRDHVLWRHVPGLHALSLHLSNGICFRQQSSLSATWSNRRNSVLCLSLTILLGLTFLGIKAVEYHDKYVDKLIPGRLIPSRPFDPSEVHLLPGAAKENIEMFYWIYFAMTGMHAIHMIIGVGLLSVILYFAARGRYDPEYHNPVEISGLYWHFVDIVWIFLFPLLYLLGRHFEH
jgi:cytochrome c oxidase subunit III